MSDPFLEAMNKEKSESESKNTVKSIVFTRTEDAKAFVTEATGSEEFVQVRKMEDFHPRIMTNVTVGTTSRELRILHEIAKRHNGEVVSA